MLKRIKTGIKSFCHRVYLLALQYEREQINIKYGFSETIKHFGVSFEGNISVGSFTYINEKSRIDTGLDAQIVIGRHCAIGRNVHITAKTHDLLQPTTMEEYPTIPHIEKDVIIGNYVWIGDNVVILPNVKIGDYAVIGANSVVNTDVKAFEIVGGTPIRHIKFNKKHIRFSN